MAEIDSNRTREDELVNAALSAAGIAKGAGGRTPLADRQAEPEPEFKHPGTISDAEVNDIADQFIRDAEQNGYKYTPDARLMLLDKIRENPENFLS